ncbi:hypothetical protein ENBRE01_2818 [Enteropsectra breve]|nr:hypothetical protein ENBRE01_2818 [Enteropsectra breve]
MARSIKKITEQILAGLVVRHEQGFSTRKLAAEMRIPVSTMAYHIKKYKKHGTSSRTAGSGRLSLLLLEEKVKVIAYFESHPRELRPAFKLIFSEKQVKECVCKPLGTY